MAREGAPETVESVEDGNSGVPLGKSVNADVTERRSAGACLSSATAPDSTYCTRRQCWQSANGRVTGAIQICPLGQAKLASEHHRCLVT